MSKKLIGAVVGVAAMAASLAVAVPSASATSPQWNADYVAGSQPNLVHVNDVLTGNGWLVFLTYLNGNPTHIICHLTSSVITHTVTSSDTLTGAPGGVISFQAALPSTISTTSNGVCEDDGNNKDYGSGVKINVSSLGSSAPLTLFVGLPAHSAGDPDQYSGSVTGWLGIPDSEISFTDPSVANCGGTGPVVNPSPPPSGYPAPATALPSGVTYSGGQVVSGSYSTTGVVSPSTSSFYVTPSGTCTVTGSQLVSSWKPIGSSTTYTTGITLDQPLTVYWQ